MSRPRKPGAAPDAVAPMKRAPKLDYGILDQLLGYSLRLAQNGLYLHFSQSCPDPDVTPQRFAAMTLIERNPGIGQSELSLAMGINRSGAMRLVDWLEARDLAERVGNGNDARRWGLRLTANGSSALSTISDAVKAHDAKLVSLLGADGPALKRMLDRLADVASRDLAAVSQRIDA